MYAGLEVNFKLPSTTLCWCEAPRESGINFKTQAAFKTQATPAACIELFIYNRFMIFSW